MNIDDLKLRTKTLVPLAVMALVVMSMVAFGAMNLANFSEKAGDIIERRDVAVVDLVRASRSMVLAPYSAFGGLIYDSASPEGRRADQGFPTAVADANARLDEAMKLSPDKIPEISKIKNRFKAIVEEAKRPIEIGLATPALSIGRGLKPEELDRLADGAMSMALVDLHTRALVDDIIEFNRTLLAENARNAADLRVRSNGAVTAMAVLGLVATMTAGAFAFWLSSFKIAYPLTQLANKMLSLARGDLTVRIEGHARRDEVGDMARAMIVFKKAAIENGRLEHEADEHRAWAVATHQETKRLSNDNLRLANVDSLTDLPNRRQFFSTLNEVLGRATRDSGRFAVGLVDLDGFKLVNDLHGHIAGDKFLIEVSRRMQDICDETIFLARLGSDEFGVIASAPMDDADIQALGVRICKALAVPFLLPGIAVELSGTIGFAAFPQAGSTAQQLMERGDYALHHAKQHQRGRPVIFSIEHETELRQFASLEHCLRGADLQSEMSLHFQPIVDVQRDRIVSFEALARWDSPKLGKVAPDVFIRVAERSDLINKLTQTLLRGALAKARTWPSEIRVSFNLSMRDLVSREAISDIVAIIESSGIEAGRIDLEVTETALIQDFDQANASLRTLKALGVGISLDDFGTGYSSLSYVRRFPIDKIKIDRSFIREVETEPSCSAIVKSVIDLCRNLNLVCIVEGLETDDQVRVVRALGCTTIQGYVFGKPMPACEVLSFLSAANAPPCLETSDVRALAS